SPNVMADPGFEQDLEEARQQVGPQTPAEDEYLREDLCLQRDHPGRFVAYIDTWSTGSDGKPHLSREVLATGRDQAELDTHLSLSIAQISAERRGQIQKTFADDPSAGLPDDRYEFGSDAQ
ncbi:MAG: hypothetical protein V1876_02585, partial [Candidatus Peregrinibacteria bacterium]